MAARICSSDCSLVAVAVAVAVGRGSVVSAATRESRRGWRRCQGGGRVRVLIHFRIRMSRRPGGPGGVLQDRARVVVQCAEQLGEGRIDRSRVHRPAGILLAEKCGVRAAEGGGKDIHASHRLRSLICLGRVHRGTCQLKELLVAHVRPPRATRHERWPVARRYVRCGGWQAIQATSDADATNQSCKKHRCVLRPVLLPLAPLPLRFPRGEGSGERRSALCRRRLRLLWRRRRALAQFGHELVELSLVLGEAQPVQEGAKLLLLFFQPAKCLHTIFIEGAVAAGRRRALPTTATPDFPAGPRCRTILCRTILSRTILPGPTLPGSTVPGSTLVTTVAVASPAPHAFAPYCVEHQRKPDRPPENQTENDSRDTQRIRQHPPMPVAPTRLVPARPGPPGGVSHAGIAVQFRDP